MYATQGIINLKRTFWFFLAILSLFGKKKYNRNIKNLIGDEALKKKYLLTICICLSVLLTVVRYLQYQNGYDPQSQLFDGANFYNRPVLGIALLTGLFFFVLTMLGEKKKPEKWVKASGFTRFSGMVLLICSIVLALSRLFLLMNGETMTLVGGIVLLFAIFMPIYALGINVLFLKEKETGLIYLALIPVAGLALYLIFAYVPITEMATLDYFMLHILSGCSLLLFFFAAAKAMLNDASQRKAAILGYLSVIYLSAQTIAYPLYSIMVPIGDITIITILTTYLCSWGLILFLFGYSNYLYDH